VRSLILYILLISRKDKANVTSETLKKYKLRKKSDRINPSL